ncbi:hypothetical protein [Kitasatospora sp. NPDC094016]|uniref:zinc finger domain-containing protein n=1 Tax=Kitasatospora sp. NPDC094016 TaxID=3154986 RepID=UPI00331BD4E3
MPIPSSGRPDASPAAHLTLVASPDTQPPAPLPIHFYGDSLFTVRQLIRDKKRAAVEAQGRRWRENQYGSAGLWLICYLAGRLTGDAPVRLDYWTAAAEYGGTPAELREAVAELEAVEAVVSDSSPAGAIQALWLNPSIAHTSDTNVVESARRHRFPQLHMEAGEATATPFHQIQWQAIEYCNTPLFGGRSCDWRLGQGLCPDHATEEQRAEAAEQAAAAKEEAMQRFLAAREAERQERLRIRGFPCPRCAMVPGEHCRTDSGGRARASHVAREVAPSV